MRDEFGPDPKSLGAGVDGGSDLKAVVLVEQNPVEDVALASPVLANNGDNRDVFILVDLVEPVDGLLVDYDSLVRVNTTLVFVEVDQLYRFGRHYLHSR